MRRRQSAAAVRTMIQAARTYFPNYKQTLTYPVHTHTPCSPCIIIMDCRLSNHAVYMIVGPSGAGKTVFTINLLSSNMFKNPIGNIFWHMGVKPNKTETDPIRSGLRNVKIVEGFTKNWMNNPKTGDVIVIDDLFSEANRQPDFNNLFTKIARHRGVTVIFLTQNLFHQGGQHRTRNLNTHYLVIFKNPRDQTIIDHISRQAFPNSKNFLASAFRDATTDKPHGYLFLDFTQNCPDEIRVRTDIFNPAGIIVYKQSSGGGVGD